MTARTGRRFVLDAHTSAGILRLEHVQGLCAAGHRFSRPTTYLAELDVEEAQDAGPASV